MSAGAVDVLDRCRAALECGDVNHALGEVASAVAELIEDRKVLVAALLAVEDTLQANEGRLGVGRYSFPANGTTAAVLRVALARIEARRHG